MKWLLLVVLVLAGGCSFFQDDNHSGHHPDAAVGLCPTMVVTGDFCPQPTATCSWGESAPDAAVVQHTCECQPDLHWTCSDHGFTCPQFSTPTGACAADDGPCLYDQSTTCSCMVGQWRCNSCPADFMSPTATCAPGRRCEYEDWEHGCSCLCDDQGYWDCTNETIGSSCPHHTVLDAGI